MAKKQILSLDFRQEYDFLLIGIFCIYRDYRLCFELNRQLELSLEKMEDLELKMEKKGSASIFTIFHYNNEDDEHYFIIANKGSNGFFIPEMKQTDYFLMVRNASRYTTHAALLPMLRDVKLISSVLELQPEQIKSAENFFLVEPV